jgi:hypothetical protein
VKCGAIVRLSSRVGDRPTKLSQFPKWANFVGSSWLLLWEIGEHHPNTLPSSALDTDTDRRPGQSPRPCPKRVALQHSSHTDKHGKNARVSGFTEPCGGDRILYVTLIGKRRPYSWITNVIHDLGCVA